MDRRPKRLRRRKRRPTLRHPTLPTLEEEEEEEALRDPPRLNEVEAVVVVDAVVEEEPNVPTRKISHR